MDACLRKKIYPRNLLDVKAMHIIIHGVCVRAFALSSTPPPTYTERVTKMGYFGAWQSSVGDLILYLDCSTTCVQGRGTIPHSNSGILDCYS